VKDIIDQQSPLMKPRNMKLYVTVTSPRTAQLTLALATSFDYTATVISNRFTHSQIRAAPKNSVAEPNFGRVNHKPPEYFMVGRKTAKEDSSRSNHRKFSSNCDF